MLTAGRANRPGVPAMLRQFTLKRLRVLLLALAGVLVLAIAGFLVAGQWKLRGIIRDIPRRLGVNIEQQADGYTYTQSRQGRTLFKIHASHVEQLKDGNRAQLHDVSIELYGQDGSRTDRITGSEFDYDPRQGMAVASGPVEITLMRPATTPAVLAQAAPSGTAAAGKPMSGNAKAVAEQAGEIHIKTSGLSFDQKSGVATTSQRVEFELNQGQGSAVGAVYDSQGGHLVLDHAVRLTVSRDGETARIEAGHADMERATDICKLKDASAAYRGGTSAARWANLRFRPDGSAERLDGWGGMDVTSANGGHLAAPTGSIWFDGENRPGRAIFQGGVAMDFAGTRTVHGTAPTLQVQFDPAGELKHAHLERGVVFRSEEARESSGSSLAAGGKETILLTRTWRSPVADLEFRPVTGPSVGRQGASRAPVAKTGAMSATKPGSAVELASIHGTGGVVVTSDSTRDPRIASGAHGLAAEDRSRMAAEDVVGVFGPDSALSILTGVGNASLEQVTAQGARQSTTGDRLEAHFVPRSGPVPDRPGQRGDAQIAWATEEGNVVLTATPAAKPGEPAAATMRATAARADYDGAGEWLHLTGGPRTGAPRIENGGLELAANRIDYARLTGEALAHGEVKASWLSEQAGPGKARASDSSPPAHGIAAEAELRPGGKQVVFYGEERSGAGKGRAGGAAARLWQQGNSVTAPVIALDRERQTLTATGQGLGNPVWAVLVSAGSVRVPNSSKTSDKTGSESSAGPTTTRVRAGELHYSDAQHLAIFRAGSAGSVTVEIGATTVVSDRAEVLLTDGSANRNHAENHVEARSPGGTDSGGAEMSGRVERMSAQGHVSVFAPDSLHTGSSRMGLGADAATGRRGTGSLLVYTSEDGRYVLTGTSADPPRMTDSQRGTVTGAILVFNSRDESVVVEGDGGRTRTETRSPH